MHNTLFAIACIDGKLNVAIHLREKSAIKLETARAIIVQVASNGHLEVLQLLFSTFDLTNEDLTVEQDTPFCFAAFYGHLKVVQWLYDSVSSGLFENCNTANVKLTRDKNALKFACLNEHFDVIEFIKSEKIICDI